MKIETATLAGGCFWCLEAIFSELNGVISVTSGYSGGTTKNPNYHDIGDHAEAVQIEFNSEIISYKEILEVFFSVHDPTTLNRQGNDIGPQYRSGIYYHSDKQLEIANNVIKFFEENNIWSNPIVTEVKPYNSFYVAEDYHQQYFDRNPDQSYCKFVIEPKVAKFRKLFFDKLRK